MSLFDAIRRSVGLKISLTLAVMLIVVLGAASVALVLRQTQQMEEQTLEKARATVSLAALQYGEKLEDAIDSGLLSVADVFDRRYVEIKGYDWGKHPKFHTRYDSVVDRMVLVFQDRILEDPDFVYAVGADENGYIPTHNSVYQKPLEGNEKDLTGNRTKRMFNNPVELKAAQNLEPGLLQVYHRDTGETMWDVASPITVKGKHWGGFRLGVSQVRVEARKASLALTLAALGAVFTLLIIAMMYLLVRRSLVPVVKLTAAAEQISLGEALDDSVKTGSTDEFGQLANAVERLRVSMKAALSRLGGGF
jgi:HAMP domain-containing protein